MGECDACVKKDGNTDRLDIGRTMYGCRICNWDMCEECHAKHQGKETDSPVSPAEKTPSPRLHDQKETIEVIMHDQKYIIVGLSPSQYKEVWQLYDSIKRSLDQYEEIPYDDIHGLELELGLNASDASDASDASYSAPDI